MTLKALEGGGSCLAMHLQLTALLFFEMEAQSHSKSFPNKPTSFLLHVLCKSYFFCLENSSFPSIFVSLIHQFHLYFLTKLGPPLGTPLLDFAICLNASIISACLPYFISSMRTGLFLLSLLLPVTSTMPGT